MKKHNIIYLIYSILLTIGIFVPSLNQSISFAIIILNLIILVLNKKNLIIVLMSSFLLYGEIFPLLNVLLCIPFSGKNRRIKIKKISIKNQIIIAIIFVNSVVCSIFYNTFVNVVFYSLYIGLLLVVLRIFENKFLLSDISNCLKKTLIVESVINISIIIKYRTLTPGDQFCGSLGNAHWFGNLLILTIFVFVYECEKNKVSLIYNLKKNSGYIIIALVMLYLADAKTLVISAVVAIIVYVVLLNNKKKSFFIFMLGTYFLIFLLMLVMYSNTVTHYLENELPLLATYLYKDGWNAKFIYIRGIFVEELKGLRLFMGFGLGQCGSRVSNMFAYNEMWRADNVINNFISTTFNSRCIPEFAKYIRFYTSDFVAAIGWRSAVMSYPFNSLTALLGETGIVGVVCVAKFLDSYINKSCVKIAAFYFLFACFFDIYFDNFPCVAILIIILVNSYEN